jgi:glycosyltransferase involved in cell wall biosynthesis
MMSKVIFIQSKLPGSKIAFEQIVSRWSTYEKALQDLSPCSSIWLFTPRPIALELNLLTSQQSIRQFPAVEAKPSFLARIMALYQEIKGSNEHVFLICGDGQQSFLLAFVMKYFLRLPVKIQFQFHGDTYSFQNNPGFKGFLRACLAHLGINFADSIRIVSQFQAEEIVKISSRAWKKLVLAPIPIDFSKVATHSADNLFDVAFVGRLHPERGVEELIRILSLIEKRRKHTKVVVVGDGPLRTDIESNFPDMIDDNRLLMMGFLPGDEIARIYGSTRVLISTAPQEGYGLTLREAVLSNVMVIARESKGVLEAQKAFTANIRTYTKVENAVELIISELNETRVKGSENLIGYQMLSDTESLYRLSKSWLSS